MLKDLNNSKDMVFDVKKQLNDVVDLTLWQRAQGMSGMSCGFRQPKAGFRRWTYQHWCLPRAFETVCGPLGPEDTAWWKIRLLADSVPAHICWQNSGHRQIGHDIFWTSLSAALCRQNADYAICKSGCPMSVHRHGMGLASGGINPQDLPLISPLLLSRCKEQKWSLNCILLFRHYISSNKKWTTTNCQNKTF